MSGLKQLLYDDLSRQYELEGKAGARPNFVGFIARLLHYRFLPNVICRTSRAAYLAGVPVIPNLFTYLNILMFGLEVTPRCEITQPNDGNEEFTAEQARRLTSSFIERGNLRGAVDFGRLGKCQVASYGR